MPFQRLVKTQLPTEYGHFEVYSYANNRREQPHLAIVNGELDGQENVLVRIHSECLTGDVLGSRRCDCGPQLQEALRRIGEEGGAVIYLR
ncbi:MAG: bifunctional 3,4-dihydroxy-2-butanone-4-phosphate synthase/GTP cyclohydrolase II, partial [Bacteroidota bacterium]